MIDRLAEPLDLPCGARLGNRLCKAAMTEGVADPRLRATGGHERLYRAWSEGGAGLLLTGNVQVDRTDLERPGNVSIDASAPPTFSAEARASLRRWTAAGTVAGNHLWMQIAHAGRQAPRYVTRRPSSPSAVQLDLLGNYATPVALSEPQIIDLIGRFAFAAVVARESGFTGVQVHGAHGYLISSFLSPVTNVRADDWGGVLANRARFLLEAVRAVRRAVGNDFPMSVKLNSDDFRKGGFTHEECLQVVRWLNDERVDLLEISGGTYEQPRLIGMAGRPDDAVPVRPSTRAREAYFLDYAAAIRAVARMPLMVTGGFRSRAGMEEALTPTSSTLSRAGTGEGGRRPGEGGGTPGEGVCDVIGLGRPLVWQPDFPRRLLARATDRVEDLDGRLRLAERGWLSPASRGVLGRALNAFAAQSWYYCQIFRLAEGRAADLSQGPWSALLEYVADELGKAWRLHRAWAPENRSGHTR
jgi:2,4-dienoyl-CoA reductase-like NADH-dependent reductase (Old Yellow Enzyme family)